MNKLRLDMPSPELVDAYLNEIAKGYGIKWTPSSRPVEGINDDDKDATGGKKVGVCQLHQRIHRVKRDSDDIIMPSSHRNQSKKKKTTIHY
jgi:hypothetical protein